MEFSCLKHCRAHMAWGTGLIAGPGGNVLLMRLETFWCSESQSAGKED